MPTDLAKRYHMSLHLIYLPQVVIHVWACAESNSNLSTRDIVFLHLSVLQLRLIWTTHHLTAWTVSTIASICLAQGMIAIFSFSLNLCCFLTPATTQINRLSGSAIHSNFLIIFLCWFLAIKPLGLAHAKQLPVAACFLFLIWEKLLPLGW